MTMDLLHKAPLHLGWPKCDVVAVIFCFKVDIFAQIAQLHRLILSNTYMMYFLYTLLSYVIVFGTL